MAYQNPKLPPVLIEAARSVAFVSWIVAGIGIPVALLLRSFATALLIVLLVAAWQLLAAVVSSPLLSRAGRSREPLRYRITRWGLIYCAISVIFCVLALQWGINLLYLSAAFLLGGLVYTSIFPRLMLKRTEVDWGVPSHVFAGQAFPVEVSLRNTGRLLGAFGLRLSAAADGEEPKHIWRLPAGGRESLRMQHYMPRRGMHKLNPVSVQTQFPLGVLEASMQTRPPEEVLVLPRLGHIDPDVLTHHGGGEARWLVNLRRKDQQGDFRSLREYRSGDNPRHIHWPTTARLKQLHVREYERRETHSMLLVLDAFVPESERPESRARAERLEKAISFVATLANLLTEKNMFYAFASYCPDLVELPYGRGPAQFFSVLETLALAEPTRRHTPSDLASALDTHDLRRGGVCLVSPGPLPQDGKQFLGPLAHCTMSVDASEPEFYEYFYV